MKKMYKDIEPMKRCGTSESKDKIRFLANCKAIEAQVYIKVTYEYPTMFITETENIFMARLEMKRQVKQITFSEQSSSQNINVSFNPKHSESISNKYLTESGYNTEENLAECAIERSGAQSFCESIFDIYHQNNDEPSLITPQIKLSGTKESDVLELIYEFADRKSENTIEKSNFDKINNKPSKKYEAISKRQAPTSEEKFFKFMECPNCHQKSPLKRNLRQSATRSTRKQILQQKARRLLEKIKSEESYELPNKKFMTS